MTFDDHLERKDRIVAYVLAAAVLAAGLRTVVAGDIEVVVRRNATRR
jgi:hypothetical protein